VLHLMSCCPSVGLFNCLFSLAKLIIVNVHVTVAVWVCELVDDSACLPLYSSSL